MKTARTIKTIEKKFTIINGEETISCDNSVEAEEHIFDMVLHNSFTSFETVEDACTVTITCR